jgi:hypothetical protein
MIVVVESHLTRPSSILNQKISEVAFLPFFQFVIVWNIINIKWTIRFLIWKNMVSSESRILLLIEPPPVAHFSTRTTLLSNADHAPGQGNRQPSGAYSFLQTSSVQGTVALSGYNRPWGCPRSPTFPTAFSRTNYRTDSNPPNPTGPAH